MNVNRRKAREKILQILFQMDVAKIEASEAIRFVLEDVEIGEKDYSFIADRVNGTSQYLAEIDEMISTYLKGWKLSRLSNIDRNILRMSTYELMFISDVSVNVTINEAIELAKTFGTSESAKFINGVLGTLVKENPKWTEKIPINRV